MKVLIIPDIHGRKFWRKVIDENSEKVDKVIFLGDYLDPYQEEIEENPELMDCKYFGDSQNLLKMLEDIVSLKIGNPDKYILLTGNHTDSYIWSKFHAATRTDYKNWEKYHNFFSENLNLFNLVWIENNVIFSHAGISEGWANRMWESLGFPEDELSSVKEIAEVLRDTPLADFNKHYIKPLGDISYWRYGEAQFGSCEWADIREHINMQEALKQNDFIPIGEDGIYQVFGHSQLQKPIITNKWAGLDCRQGFIFDTLTHECKSCL
jgi:hypothetical protein